MMRQLVSIAAAIALLVLCSPPPQAWALSMPVVDPAALPADGPPGPDQEMRQSGQCSFFGALPGFDPAAAPPSQDMLNLPEAWKTSRGRGVAVAVIDSGVTPQPRLANLNPGGDYIDPAANGLVDCDGHGTVVAGIIAAQPGADGFSGVAPEAALVSIRQSSAQWSPKIPSGGDPQQVKTAGDVATLARAVRHAADMPGVRVINISLIDCIPSYKQVDQAALGAALRYAAIDKDIVVVAAAGNTGDAGLFVLAGERSTHRRHVLDPAIYREAASRLDRHFTITIVDCGSTLDAPVTQEALRDLDALIVVSSPWVDGASAAGQILEWLANRGESNLLQRTVVVLNDSDGHADKRTRTVLAEQFTNHGLVVMEVPFDPHLRPGGVIDVNNEMSPKIRRRFYEIAAAIADHFSSTVPGPREQRFR